MAGTLSQIKKSILTGKKSLPLKEKETPPNKGIFK